MHCHVAVPGAGGGWFPRNRVGIWKGLLPRIPGFREPVFRELGGQQDRELSRTGLQQGTPSSPRHEHSTLVRDVTGVTYIRSQHLHVSWIRQERQERRPNYKHHNIIPEPEFSRFLMVFLLNMCFFLGPFVPVCGILKGDKLSKGRINHSKSPNLP